MVSNMKERREGRFLYISSNPLLDACTPIQHMNKSLISFPTFSPTTEKNMQVFLIFNDTPLEVRESCEFLPSNFLVSIWTWDALRLTSHYTIRCLLNQSVRSEAGYQLLELAFRYSSLCAKSRIQNLESRKHMYYSRDGVYISSTNLEISETDFGEKLHTKFMHPLFFSLQYAGRHGIPHGSELEVFFFSE